MLEELRDVSPGLGDGRGVRLGEVVDVRHVDSGRLTPGLLERALHFAPLLGQFSLPSQGLPHDAGAFRASAGDVGVRRHVRGGRRGCGDEGSQEDQNMQHRRFLQIR